MQSPPENYFQLYDGQHADFQLGRNGQRLSMAERYLWLNIALYAQVIKEHGLEGKLEEAYQDALARYPEIARERHQRHNSQALIGGGAGPENEEDVGC